MGNLNSSPFHNIRVDQFNAGGSLVGSTARKPVVFRAVTSHAKGKPDPVAMKIVEAFSGFENDPKFNLGNHGYTLRRAKGKGSSSFIAFKNEKVKEVAGPSRPGGSMRT